MSKYWVVAADASRARIFSREKKFSPLAEEEGLVHGESRLKREELTRDRPGQVFESATPGENINAEPTDPRSREAEVFARELGEKLGAIRASGQMQGLTLIAEPRFLGRLRDHLDRPTREQVLFEVGKNLTRSDTETIARAADPRA